MIVYVDEMPKSCSDCLDCKRDNLGFYCSKRGIIISNKNVENKRLPSCPLHHISERDKELIEKIKLAIRMRVHLMEDNEHCYPQNAVCWGDVVAILDHVSRENNYGE